jgi:hypothetical protein
MQPPTTYLMHYQGPNRADELVDVVACVDADTGSLAWKLVATEHQLPRKPRGQFKIAAVHGPNAKRVQS